MKFRKVFRGYDPKQVDNYIATKEESDAMALQAQRERVQQLLEQNNNLAAQVEKYQANEKAVSQALAQSQQLAAKLKNNAEKFSEVVLLRAKLFYATWQAYSKTLVASLSSEELARFNEIKEKLDNLLAAYEGKDAMGQTADLAIWANGTKKTVSHSRSNRGERYQDMIGYANPISRVEDAAGVSIELKELLHPEQSLADICKDLGLSEGDGITLTIPEGED